MFPSTSSASALPFCEYRGFWSSTVGDSTPAPNMLANAFSGLSLNQAPPSPPKSPSPNYSDQAPLHFTATNKMSLFSLEKRIDYHLSRIMKGHRLINFKNSIERLPTEKRICECILEVLMSSMNLINRKTKIISESKEMAQYLAGLADQVKSAHVGNAPLFESSSEYCNRCVFKLGEIKSLAIGLEQIIWALNSNKEHIKYIVKVFTVPDKYQRSEFTSDISSIVPMRTVISEVIEQCEEVITICRLLRGKLSEALIKWFMGHF